MGTLLDSLDFRYYLFRGFNGSFRKFADLIRYDGKTTSRLAGAGSAPGGTAGPAGGSVSYPDGHDADGDVTIAVDAGTDALSGVAFGEIGELTDGPAAQGEVVNVARRMQAAGKNAESCTNQTGPAEGDA